MGVPNSQKYKISKHATMRIRTRFNIPKTKVQTWTQRFLSEASFFKNNDDSKENIQIYRDNDVLMVLNIEEYTVVTAYPYNPLNKTNGLNPEILKRLRPSLHEIIEGEQIRLRNDLDGKMLDLQLAYQAYQNHPKSKELLEGYSKVVNDIHRSLEMSQKLIDDVQNLVK